MIELVALVQQETFSSQFHNANFTLLLLLLSLLHYYHQVFGNPVLIYLICHESGLDLKYKLS